MNSAFFIRYPRRIDDLRRPHLVQDERTFEIINEIVLPSIDYENFITDMRADRQFLEDSAGLCAEGKPMKCLLVRGRGQGGGVLVVPDAPRYPAYVKWAAYITGA